jgi:hypothetical protein
MLMKMKMKEVTRKREVEAREEGNVEMMDTLI